MSKQQVKLNNWPFNKGEQARLIWISSPFQYNKKVMIHVYFRAGGKTEKVLVDWGTLPSLAIQHYYLNGDISKSIPPLGTEEVEIKIDSESVTKSEREWRILGTEDKDTSRSFVVNYENKSYILPLIEVVRSILAPNRFLLYRLFETNSFPQYFIEQYEINKIHLDFSSQYHRKYTKDNFLYQLIWLLSNQDLRSIFENIAYTFFNTGVVKFDWLFKQPITIRAIVKPNIAGDTILRIISIKNKKIPYQEISFTHPEIVQSEKSSEVKKYTIHNKSSNASEREELTLDEEVEGTTDNFDLIEIDSQMHEYVKLPKVTKIRRSSNKKRDFEDENTKKRFTDNHGRRSTADVGGSQVARGIEKQSLSDIQVEGELGEFIKVMRVLQDYDEVQSINIIQGSLKEFSDTKRFVYLSDGMTERKYVIAEIRLFSEKDVSVIEIEREDKSISTLIFFVNNWRDKRGFYQRILRSLIDSSGTWKKEIFDLNDTKLVTLRHGKKNIKHRAKLLKLKLSSLSL